jgi:hypothetical protein
MRKMKKFLAVALSAAMVLSVSVPAMAAGEAEIELQTASQEKAYEDAKAEEEIVKADYDEKRAELAAAQQAYDMVRGNYSKEELEAELQQAKNQAAVLNQEALSDLRDCERNKELVKQYQKELVVAKDELTEANADVPKKKDAMDKAQAEWQKTEAGTPEEEAAAKKYNDARDAYNAAVTRKNDASEAYDEALGLYNGAVEYQEELDDAYAASGESAREANKVVDAIQDKLDAIAKGVDPIAKAKADLEAAQEAVAEAQIALDEAQAKTRAAAAKLNEAGKIVSEANYEAAVKQEALAAKWVAQDEERLQDAKDAHQEAKDAKTTFQGLVKAVEEADKTVTEKEKAANDASLEAYYLAQAAEAWNDEDSIEDWNDYVSYLYNEEDRANDYIDFEDRIYGMTEAEASEKFPELYFAYRAFLNEWNAENASEALTNIEDEIEWAEKATIYGQYTASMLADKAQEAAGKAKEAEDELRKAEKALEAAENALDAAIAKLGAEDVDDALDILDAAIEDAKDDVKIAEENLEAMKAYHEATKKDLENAIEEYEYYHGNKPDEPTPAEQEEAAKEAAAQAAIIAKFTDVVAGEWYVPFVTHVYNNDIMKGMSTTVFGVNSPLQRQDFAVMLYRMAKATYTGKSSFVDDLGDYYSSAIAWAAKEGIVKGYADTGYTVFGVGDDITREEFVVMLYRYFKWPETTGSLEGFADASKVSSWAVKAMKWAVENGAIQGKTAADGSKLIDPQAKISRAEAAKIIDILCY